VEVTTEIETRVHENIDHADALEVRRLTLEARRERLCGQVDALAARYAAGVDELARLGATPETAEAVLAEVVARETEELAAAEVALTEAEALADLAERLYREAGL
jgi:hypothetical protein